MSDRKQTIQQYEQYDLFNTINIKDGADSNLDNKKIYEKIYKNTKIELEKFLDTSVLESKDILILVETATEFDKINANYRIYDKELATSNVIDPILGPIGIKSWTTPFNKPLIYNHDTYNAIPIGRVLYAMIDGNINYVGSYVSDQDAIEKIMDKRLYTKSVGFYAYKSKCSICGSDIEYSFFESAVCSGNNQTNKDDKEVVKHVIGKEYNNEIAAIKCGQIFTEISYVNTPATHTSKTEFYKKYSKDSVGNGNSPMDFNRLNWTDNNMVVFQYDTAKKFYVPGSNAINKTSMQSTPESTDDDIKINNTIKERNMNDILDKISALDSKLTEINTTLGHYKNLIAEKDVKITELETNLTDLTASNDSLKSAIDKLTQDVNEYHKDELIAELIKLASDNSELNISVDISFLCLNFLINLFTAISNKVPATAQKTQNPKVPPPIRLVIFGAIQLNILVSNETIKLKAFLNIRTIELNTLPNDESLIEVSKL